MRSRSRAVLTILLLLSIVFSGCQSEDRVDTPDNSSQSVEDTPAQSGGMEEGPSTSEPEPEWDLIPRKTMV